MSSFSKSPANKRPKIEANADIKFLNSNTNLPTSAQLDEFKNLKERQTRLKKDLSDVAETIIRKSEELSRLKNNNEQLKSNNTKLEQDVMQKQYDLGQLNEARCKWNNSLLKIMEDAPDLREVLNSLYKFSLLNIIDNNDQESFPGFDEDNFKFKEFLNERNTKTISSCQDDVNQIYMYHDYNSMSNLLKPENFLLTANIKEETGSQMCNHKSMVDNLQKLMQGIKVASDTLSDKYDDNKMETNSNGVLVNGKTSETSSPLKKSFNDDSYDDDDVDDDCHAGNNDDITKSEISTNTTELTNLDQTDFIDKKFQTTFEKFSKAISYLKTAKINERTPFQKTSEYSKKESEIETEVVAMHDDIKIEEEKADKIELEKNLVEEELKRNQDRLQKNRDDREEKTKLTENESKINKEKRRELSMVDAKIDKVKKTKREAKEEMTNLDNLEENRNFNDIIFVKNEIKAREDFINSLIYRWIKEASEKKEEVGLLINIKDKVDFVIEHIEELRTRLATENFKLKLQASCEIIKKRNRPTFNIKDGFELSLRKSSVWFKYKEIEVNKILNELKNKFEGEVQTFHSVNDE